tara:strand:+ start:1456 stop:1923 length:468 start_codon:yes stop_codon:yes gene_type:complete
MYRAVDTVGLEMSVKMSRIAKFAHNKAGDTYGGRPYDYHLQHVALEVGELVGYDDPYYHLYQIVAYGHDLFEDTDVDAEYLHSKGFSEIVTDAIKALTKRKGERRIDYIKRVQENPIARKVKIADSLSNLTHSVRDGDRRRISKYTANLRELHYV